MPSSSKSDRSYKNDEDQLTLEEKGAMFISDAVR